MELCRLADVNLRNGGGYDEVHKFQNYLKSNYKICVYLDRYGNDVYQETLTNPLLKKVDLLLDNNHFYTISSKTAAFTCSYYCDLCHKASSNKLAQRCPYKCRLCFSESKCNELPFESRIYCKDCNRRFQGKRCFYAHFENGVCKTFKVCLDCDRMYNLKALLDGEKHECNTSYCTVCVQKRPIVHDCFMPKYKTKRDCDEPNEPDSEEEEGEEWGDGQKKKNKTPLFISIDFETTQNNLLNDYVDKLEHRPNLCVTANVCRFCIESPGSIDSPCEMCGFLHVSCFPK